MLFAMVTFLFATRAAVRQLLSPGIEQRAFRMGSADGLRSQADGWFSEADVAELSRIAHTTVAPASFFECGVDKANLSEANCGHTTRAYVEMWDSELHVSTEGLDRWDATRNGVIVTAPLAARHNWHVGDHISLYRPSTNNPDRTLDLEVSYIATKFLNPKTVYLHREYFIQRFLGLFQPQYWVVWGLVDKPENRQAAMDAWDAKMKLVRPHLMSTMEQTKQALLNGSRVLREGFEAAGLLSGLLVVFLSVAVTTLSIEQRTTEFAALRAIGYRRGTLALSVLIEGLLVLMPGALLGAFGLWLPVHDRPIEFEAIFHVTVRLADVGTTAGYGAVIGLVSAALPAWRVFRLDILQALR